MRPLTVIGVAIVFVLLCRAQAQPAVIGYEHVPIIFANIGGKPAVLEYRAPIYESFDPSRARRISFKEAARRIPTMKGSKPPILFAPPGGAVIHATKGEATALLRDWQAGKHTKIPRRTKASTRNLGVIAH